MLPKKLKKFNLHIDGTGYAGRATELDLPNLARKMETYRAAGMGPVKVDMGEADDLELGVTLAEWPSELIKLFGSKSANGVRLRFFGAMQSDGTTSVTDAVEIAMAGRFEEMELPSIKDGDDAPFKLKIPLVEFTFIKNGEEIIHIDHLNYIYRVNGTDINEELRAALAL